MIFFPFLDGWFRGAPGRGSPNLDFFSHVFLEAQSFSRFLPFLVRANIFGVVQPFPFSAAGRHLSRIRCRPPSSTSIFRSNPVSAFNVLLSLSLFMCLPLRPSWSRMATPSPDPRSPQSFFFPLSFRRDPIDVGYSFFPSFFFFLLQSEYLSFFFFSPPEHDVFVFLDSRSSNVAPVFIPPSKHLIRGLQ